jgi:hypothetical protein
VSGVIFQDPDFFQALSGGGQISGLGGLVVGDFEEDSAVGVQALWGFSEDLAVDREAVEAAV